MTKVDFGNVLKKFPTGCLCNAHPAVKAMSAEIRPLESSVKLVGPARTAKTIPGQNAAIHRAVALAEPGDVLVIDGGGSKIYGPFGDILARACQNQGVQGLVIDSTIRDREEIRALGFPVFSLGGNPASTIKEDPGEIDVEISCGGVTVLPGDYIVGDEDGVVVVPAVLVPEIIGLAQKVLEKEEKIIRDLKSGKTTCEIFGIPV